ncbi:hypothetical protein SAMN04487931_104232 [Desulfobacula phenolica]|uniref:Uncharacterized protein n=1 Tax=Desulfobacula phenolica TaxID=90732 RepID=A0A1H2FM55_9BACT|nr:hypothetical protein SAMN04487931_104232 [Desulfobacula phenolica]
MGYAFPFIFYKKVFKNPNSDFQTLLWANLSEKPDLPVPVI